MDSLPPSGSNTPRISYSGINFTPRQAMASFENLVALANHQERLKEARKMVWRDRGEPAVETATLRECFTHAMSGGFSELFRSFLSFISYLIFFGPRVRHSGVQYTRFIQCYP